MPRIKLTPEEMQQESRDLQNSKVQNDEAIKRLDQIVNGLLSHWRGDAQTAFVNSYNQKRNGFLAFSRDIETLARFVSKFSGDMANKEGSEVVIARSL